MAMKINLDKLFWAVMEALEDYNQYRQHYGKKKHFQMTREEQERGIWLNKVSDKSDKAVATLCDVLGIDYKKLNTLARMVKKWEEKRNWQLCFPFDKSEKQIIEYLTAK